MVMTRRRRIAIEDERRGHNEREGWTLDHRQLLMPIIDGLSQALRQQAGKVHALGLGRWQLEMLNLPQMVARGCQSDTDRRLPLVLPGELA